MTWTGLEHLKLAMEVLLLAILMVLVLGHLRKGNLGAALNMGINAK